MQAVFGGNTNDQEAKKLGREGEDLAANFLGHQGFRILERNYRCRLGEVDLIAEKKGDIRFIEVKTRRSTDAVSPLELISPSKQRHISRVALHYLASKRWQERGGGFDLLIVHWKDNASTCELIKDAFNLAWGY